MIKTSGFLVWEDTLQTMKYFPLLLWETFYFCKSKRDMEIHKLGEGELV